MKIVKMTEIEPEPSLCIEVDAEDKLFCSGGVTGNAIVSHNSVAQRNILISCIMRPEHWRVIGVDMKRVELSFFRQFSNVILGVATELEDALLMLRFAQQAMMKRYTEMESLGVTNIIDLGDDKPQSLLVMVDEMSELVSGGGSDKSERGKEIAAMKAEIQVCIGSIARLGRAAGVHLVLATQSPYATILDGETKALSTTTPILTKSGWSTMGAIREGDYVHGTRGDWVKVVATTEEMRDHECFTVSTSDGSSLVADAGHLWTVVELSRGGIKETLTTQDIYHGMTSGRTYMIERPMVTSVGNKASNEKWGAWIKGILLGSRNKDRMIIHDESCRNYIKSKYRIEKVTEREYLLGDLSDVQFSYDEIMTADAKTRLEFIRGFMDAAPTVLLCEDSGDEKNTYVWCEGSEDRNRTHEIIHSVLSSLQIDSTLVKNDAGNINLLVKPNQQIFHRSKNAIRLSSRGYMPTDEYIQITEVQRTASVPVRCISVDSEDKLFLAGESLIPTHNSNVAVRINCGRTSNRISSMVLDNAEGSRVKGSPKGRLYLQIHGQGDHGQGFFAPQEWVIDWLASKGLNPDGTPIGSSPAERNDRMADEMSAFGEENPVEKAGGGSEDQWDSEMDDLMALNE